MRRKYHRRSPCPGLAPCKPRTSHVCHDGRFSWYTFDPASTPIGLDATLKYIDEVAEAQGPFDGIIGFSQGACTAALLGMLAAHPDDHGE